MPAIESDELEALAKVIENHIEATSEPVTAIAERAGVGRSVVSQLRSREYRSSPSLDVVARIAAACGVAIVFQSTD